MIPEAKAIKLIKIYFYICEQYDIELKQYCERFSNNNQPQLTDQEIMTIYLYTIHEEQRLTVKQIYQFADDYLRSWFPSLGSYASFNNRLNRLCEAFGQLVSTLLEQNQPQDCLLDQSLLDSMPIITCSGKRSAKVARDIADKGYCPTKSMYYYGLKLHALGFRRPGKLPHPEEILLTPASESDLNVYKQAWSEILDRVLFGDKGYSDIDFNNQAMKNYHLEMLTPVKAVKGMEEQIKQRIKAADDLFSTAVSRIRQPIESLFNWLIQKTDIQKASTVRSTNGLLVHAFGRLAAVYISLAI
jgi:hypothetical protein